MLRAAAGSVVAIGLIVPAVLAQDTSVCGLHTLDRGCIEFHVRMAQRHVEELLEGQFVSGEANVHGRMSRT